MWREKGFSLNELMIVIAIMAIVTVVSIPSYLRWRDNTRVQNAASNIRADFERAKLRAIRENGNVRVVFLDATSYMLHVDTNGNNAIDAGEVTVANKTLPEGVSISGNTFSGSDMSFNARGLPVGGPGGAGTVSLMSAGGRQYDVIVNSVGRVRTVRH